MADVLFVCSMLVFLSLSVLLVRICDRIIGPDEDVVVGAADDEPGTEAMAA